MKLFFFLLFFPVLAWAQWSCLPAPCGTGSPLVVRSLSMADNQVGAVAGWSCPDPYAAKRHLIWAMPLPNGWMKTAAELASMTPKACEAAVATLANTSYTAAPVPELLQVERRQVLNALPEPRWIVRTNGTFLTRPTYAANTNGTRGAQIGSVTIKQADGTPQPCYPDPMRVVEGSSVYGEVKVEQEKKRVELALCSRVQ